MFRKTVFLAFLVSFFTAALFLSFAFSAKSDMATVISTQGSVLVKFPGKRWSNVSIGMPVEENTILRTAYDSYCEVAIDKSLKNVFSIGPETEITVGEKMENIQIAKGRVFTLMDGLASGSSFEVRTPIASGGARGTAWETIAGGNVKFSMADGVIYVKGLGKSGDVTGEINLKDGFSVIVDENGRIGDAKPLSKKDIERLKKWIKRIKENIEKYKNKKNWKALIDNYGGENPDLFSELLKLDAGKSRKPKGEKKKGAKIELPFASGPDSGTPGSDITSQTFRTEGSTQPADDSGGGDDIYQEIY